MFKFIAPAIAGISLAVSTGVLADDVPPTPPEMVGYAQSLAEQAHRGDKRALEFLQTHAAAEDPQAEFGLGEFYLLGKNYAQSVTWFQKSASQGFAGGYYALGQAYESGQGLPRDYAQAMQMYLKAADQLPSVQTNIGLLYAHGHGVKQDYAQASSWYRKAAEAGDVEADLDLGSLYLLGQGVPQSESEAIRWYKKAADQGIAQAEYRLGSLYAHSKSSQDYRQAAYWYDKAGQQGVAEAQLDLGMLYQDGKGVPKDSARAIQWFQMAANQGNGHAQYQLANGFANGEGVPKDPFRAYQWMSIAKASLDEKDPVYSAVLKNLKDWEQQLGPAQVVQARKAAEAWLQEHGARKE
ncbi:MAG TPA: tetratricopeptide repeat protein [Gammaproteobacteria bacterium]|nr:tetratricopeptide repeat protein [Gammaproteobacteria bacterium]